MGHHFQRIKLGRGYWNDPSHWHRNCMWSSAGGTLSAEQSGTGAYSDAMMLLPVITGGEGRDGHTHNVVCSCITIQGNLKKFVERIRSLFWCKKLEIYSCKVFSIRSQKMCIRKILHGFQNCWTKINVSLNSIFCDVLKVPLYNDR